MKIIQLLLTFTVSVANVACVFDPQSPEVSDSNTAVITQQDSKAPRPNILVILTDDLGYADVGFNGGTDIVTPNLDRLAKQGTVFSAAYNAHPFCGPSRASLMSGRYAHTFGAQFNLPTIESDKGFPVDETFMSKVLNDAGYFTGAIGKWHLGEAPQFHPNVRGFDEFFGFLGGGHEYFPAEYLPKYDDMVRRKVKKEDIRLYLRPMEHNGVVRRQTEYVTDVLSSEASVFIRKAKQKNQPFFLYLAYNAPHAPMQAKEEDMAKLSHIKDQKRKTYAAMVYAVDRGVKDIVDTLKSTGQFDNTLIVFFSDNGGKPSQGASNIPLREGKGSVHEGGYRTPMLFHWPEVVPAGQRFDHPIATIDFYPTFVGLAGAADKLPKDKKLDGKDIWKDFIAGQNPHLNEPIYVMRHRDKYSDGAIRRDEWKAVRVNRQPWRLYNIENDISEKVDLSAKHPKVLKELVGDIEHWSHTHTEPLWFHVPQAEETWKKNNMPKFDEMFKLK